MMPHVHLLLGIAGANVLALWGYNSYLLWFILGSIFPDIDFVMNLIIKKNSHRQLPTHFPLFYLLGVLFLGIWSLIPFFWFFIGGLFHVIVDIVDWKIYILAPLSQKPFSFLNLNYERMMNEGSLVNFLLSYYQKKMIVLEIIAFVICIWSQIL